MMSYTKRTWPLQFYLKTNKMFLKILYLAIIDQSARRYLFINRPNVQMYLPLSNDSNDILPMKGPWS